jgi:CRP/FNR family transcriptional regulator, cyclic AMP receptor protein
MTRRSSIDYSILARVNQSSAISFSRKEIVYSQGDRALLVFFVRTGTLKVTTALENGREAIAGLHFPGNFFGEECLAGHELRIATVTSLTECKLVQMPKASVMYTLCNDPEFSELFTTCLIKRSIRMQADLVDQLLNSTEKRLARLLLILSNYGTEGQPESIAPSINQEMIAEMIGASRSNVNLFMNKFRKLGFIEYNGNIKVNRSLLDAVLHEKPQTAE